MLKRLLTIVILTGIVLSGTVYAANYPDVSPGKPYYNAIMSLDSGGIMNGYEDGTFRPDGYINRAEAAAIIVRASGLDTSEEKSIYSDVSAGHWARGYIMSATNAGIINGFGNGVFSPDGQVTYEQILKMIVCMAGLEKNADYYGGWPSGYVDAAYHNDIIDASVYGAINYDGAGSSPATRKDVAVFIYNALSVMERNTLCVDGKKFELGMSADILEKPDEILDSTGNFRWYVYGTDTYENFFSVGVDNDTIVALASSGVGFVYMGYNCGDVLKDGDDDTCIYTDSNDGNIIHGILMMDDNYGINYFHEQNPTRQQLLGESKMNFHFTNAFRVYHGMKPFKWSDKAAASAQLHSEDMAVNNYFSHSNLNGISSSERISAQGINWSSCAENIAAGNSRYLGFHSYDGWVNSSGHRNNMLSNNTYLGVGIAYTPDSTYNYYHTQNFYSTR